MRDLYVYGVAHDSTNDIYRRWIYRSVTGGPIDFNVSVHPSTVSTEGAVMELKLKHFSTDQCDIFLASGATISAFAEIEVDGREILKLTLD